MSNLISFLVLAFVSILNGILYYKQGRCAVCMFVSGFAGYGAIWQLSLLVIYLINN